MPLRLRIQAPKVNVGLIWPRTAATPVGGKTPSFAKIELDTGEEDPVKGSLIVCESERWPAAAPCVLALLNAASAE